MDASSLASRIASWSSTPLVRATWGSGDDALVHAGHAIRDEFIVAGTSLDDAIRQAGELAQTRTNLWGNRPHTSVAVLQAQGGSDYLLAGLSSDAWDASRSGTGEMVLDGGRWLRAGDGRQLRPTMLGNQATAPALPIDGPLDFGPPLLERLHPDVVAVVGQAGRVERFM